MALTAGTRLGPYDILAPLGAGGFGEVYKARDTRLDRTVAIKILPSADPELKARFEREAKAIAALQHPHICTLFDVGHQDGTDYLVLEYLDGETLAKRLERGPLTLDDALKIGVEIADALDKAHRVGIVHRDLKPGNIVLTKSGVKLLDFGLAKLRPAQAGAVSGLSMAATVTTPPITGQGTILGTLQYMSPEQLEGKEADARSDIWALGCVLYEMLTGMKAFQGTSHASVISAIMSSTPPAITARQPIAPGVLDRIIATTLAKDPDARFQSAHDLTLELSWISERGSEAIDTSRRSGAARVERVIWAVAVLVLGAALMIVSRRAPPPAAAAAARFEVGAPPTTEFVLMPEISPDGRRLAVVGAGQNGVRRLWVRTLDLVQFQAIPGTEGVIYPFWSADSRSVAFFADGKLKRVEVVGGAAPQTLCDAPNPRGGAWNRDDIILFAPSNAGGLFRLPATGGAPEPVTSLSDRATEWAHRYPHFLPDGRHFLFFQLTRKPETEGVYIGSLDRQDTRRVVTAFSKGVYGGGRLLFVRDGTLMAQPFDGVRGLTQPGEIVALADGLQFANEGGYAFSASETGVLAYAHAGRRVTTQLTWFDRAGRRLGVVGPSLTPSQPELSPDETRLAFREEAEGKPHNLWITELGRHVDSRFTFNSLDDRDPVWSPDGRLLVYSSPRDGWFNLYVRPVDGGGPEEPLVVDPTHKESASWSPDGKLIVYIRRVNPSTSDLMMVPVVGDHKPVVYLSNGFAHSHARVSPDGRWLTYVGNESGRTEVYVQRFPKPGIRWQVSTDGGVQPRWRKDGRELFYISAALKMMVVSVSSGASDVLRFSQPVALFEAPVHHGTAQSTFEHQYDVTKDGQRFVLNLPVGVPSPPLTVIVNWPDLIANHGR